MKLKYSSVEQPEFVGYLALLKPKSELEIEEFIGHGEIVTRIKIIHSL